MKVIPFGGPGSGLWPSGSARDQGVGPHVAGPPAPPPPPACITPDIFSDCFTGCLGPAPACGWTPTTPPVTVLFDTDLMVMGKETSPLFPFGRAEKPTLIAMPPVSFTVQFRFHELAGPAVPGAVYRVTVTDPGGGAVTDIHIAGTGAIAITHGPSGGAAAGGPGTWVPLGGGAGHTVHYDVGSGAPTLFFDGVLIPLTPSGPLPLPPQTPGTVAAMIDSGASLFKGSFDWIMVATGIFPPTTAFCCPGGGPPT